MKAKLDGRDPDPGYHMNVSEQVMQLSAACANVCMLSIHMSHCYC